ncbi:hypothetical protein PILCRDRAFT_812977 [Piloderma croceum F 1598]|uniref:Pentacotripeptide-repeat region of PRORP domain-containing protein n=1 Tax=Piloderma croceum (strain F 1598) TaxID=765440 RepID=A0A0C3BRH6_PILCF|nr:hypothetical protein PILCRDRAFT_812977 [Piloderma croceum F 1598]
MYLCRHLLLARIIPTPPPTFFVSRRFLSDTSHPQSHVQDGDTVGVNNVTSSTHDASSTHDTSSTTQLSDGNSKPFPRRRKSLRLHKLLPKPAKAIPPSAAATPKAIISPEYKHVDAYEVLRKRDIRVVRNLPVDTIILIAEEAISAGRADVIDRLAIDVADNLRGIQAKSLKVVSSIVDIHIKNGSTSYAQLHPFLLLLQSSGSIEALPSASFVRLLKFLIKQLSDNPSSDMSMPMLLALLDKFLIRFPAAKGAAAIVHQPQNVVKLSFALLEKLIHARRDKDALEVFRVLVSRNNIPPEAIRDTNHTTSDSGFIIISTLVRSCLHWGWRRLAIHLCKILLRKKRVVPPDVITLTVDVLYAILEVPEIIDLQQFSALALELGTRALDFEIPHGLIRLYYKSAHTYEQGQSAEVLFEHTQSSQIVSRHTYPPPQGNALVWLLHHLTLNTNNTYLARRLVDYVVGHREPIPPQDRGRFIALTAACGFGLQARTLWERYTVGRDSDLVFGHAGAMLRLVSLFSSITRKTQSQLVQVIDKEQREGTIEDTQNMRELYKCRTEDVSAFVNSVIAEYRRLQEPLALAHHFPLTSLARAYFMIGNVTAGFETFQILLNRKEIPDLYDINVALSAMAEYTPSGAAKMITTMIDKGVRPDAVTFGTVMHFAALNKDTQLVGSLIKQARLIDDGTLTLKSVQSLIRASIEMEDDPELLGANLERALEIIQSLKRAKLVCSPRTGTYCVNSALKLNSPVLAFKFWRLLINGKFAWNDTHHIKLRRLISHQVDRYREAGLLTEERARVMQFLMRHERRQ